MPNKLLIAKTASVVVSDTTEHGVCETDVARAIRILNGFVVLDILSLIHI